MPTLTSYLVAEIDRHRAAGKPTKQMTLTPRRYKAVTREIDAQQVVKCPDIGTRQIYVNGARLIERSVQAS